MKIPNVNERSGQRCLHRKLVGVLMAGVIFVACTPQMDPETEVLQRSESRWGLMIEGNFDEAYDFYSPGYRQTTDLDAFIREAQRRAIAWTNAEILDVDCQSEQDKCLVTLSLTYEVRQGPAQLRGMQNTREITEQWIYIDQNWWYVAPE